MTRKTANHTPGSLHVHMGRDGADLHANYQGTDKPQHHIVAIVTTVRPEPYGNLGTAHANAARLALCWNTHDEFVEACVAFNKWATGHDADDISADKLEAASTLISAVLAKATP